MGGLVTNSDWQCSDQMAEGWTLPDFMGPPDTFSSPNLLGSNGVAPWGVRPSIVEDADWIWPQGSSTMQSHLNCISALQFGFGQKYHLHSTWLASRFLFSLLP